MDTLDPNYNAELTAEPELSEEELQETVGAEIFPEEPSELSPEPDLDVLPPMDLPERSDAEIADEIAQAIAATFDSDENPPSPEVEPEQLDNEETDASEASEVPEPMGEAEQERIAPEEEPSEQQTAQLEAPSAPKEAKKEHKHPEPSVNSAQLFQKIPSGSSGVSFLDSLGMTIADIRSRRNADLPSAHASLKAAEKRYAQITKISGMMNPVRYILIILMVLALLGRRYPVFTLGFLGGTRGIYAALICTVISMALSFRSLIRGVRDAGYMRFSFETLFLITTVLSAVDMIAQQNESTLLPFLSIGWCLMGMQDLMDSSGKLRSLRSVLAGTQRIGVRVVQKLWNKTDCIGKAPASTSGFVRKLEYPDTFHTVWSFFALPLLLISVILSAYLTARTSGNYVSILATLLTAALPISAVLCCARPYEILTRALGRKGAVSGWFGIKMLSGKKTMLIYDTDLYPKGAITHKGVRVYGNQTPRLLVSYGASLVQRADNGLMEPFMELLREVNGEIYRVSNFEVTEGGLFGKIFGVEVAVGTYNYMQLVGVVMPPNSPQSGLFIALNGEIAGLFAIKYQVMPGAQENFHRIVTERTLKPVAATKNLNVNPTYMLNQFGIPVGDILCPKIEARWKLSDPKRVSKGISCGYLMTENIVPYSRLVAGSRRTNRMGLLFTIASIVCSLFFMIQAAISIASGTAILWATRLLLVQVLFFLAEEIAVRWFHR